MINKINYFIVWGGVVISSFIFNAFVSSNLMIFVDAVLIGLGIGCSVVLAIGKDIKIVDEFKEKHKSFAIVLEWLGKIDSLGSIFVLPLIGMAFFQSMGWGEFEYMKEYAVFLGVVLCVLWSVCLILGGWYIYINKRK